jgi:hypothetical protein
MNLLWERWQRWVMSFGCTDQGRAVALELSHDEIVRLEPVITYALMNTTDQLRIGSVNGEPLTMMGLRNCVDGAQGVTLWYRVPWWPRPEA